MRTSSYMLRYVRLVGTPRQDRQCARLALVWEKSREERSVWWGRREGRKKGRKKLREETLTPPSHGRRCVEDTHNWGRHLRSGPIAQIIGWKEREKRNPSGHAGETKSSPLIQPQRTWHGQECMSDVTSSIDEAQWLASQKRRKKTWHSGYLKHSWHRG